MGRDEDKLKRTLEESYQRGRNTGRVNIIGVEVGASILSGGMGRAANKTATTAARLTYTQVMKITGVDDKIARMLEVLLKGK